MNKEKAKRGFALLPPEEQREIARRGGISVHEKGVAYKFPTREAAREAGRKGGIASSRDSARMKELGRLGGLKRAENRKMREEVSS